MEECQLDRSRCNSLGTLTAWQQIAQDVAAELSVGRVEAEKPARFRGSQLLDVERNHTPDIFYRVSSRSKSVPQDTDEKLSSPVTKNTSSLYNEYELLTEIGCGAFGRAIKARRRKDNELVVVKEIKLSCLGKDEASVRRNEVKLLSHLKHPNVVRYYDCFADQLLLNIVMENCEEGDLAKYLKLRKKAFLDEEEIMLKFVQICLALHYVHQQGILHRDLKTSNIFLAQQGIVKLGDFGIAKVLEDFATAQQSVVGTPNYLSPEMCKSMPYGLKSDVWALGCVLYELCCLKPAFQAENFPATIVQILEARFKPLPDGYSSQLKGLVKQLLCQDPSRRPTLDEILNQDYVRGHLQKYQKSLQECVLRRQDSLKAALAQFNLDPSRSLHFGGQISSLSHRTSSCLNVARKLRHLPGALNSPAHKSHRLSRSGTPVCAGVQPLYPTLNEAAGRRHSVDCSARVSDVQLQKPGSNYVQNQQPDSHLPSPSALSLVMRKLHCYDSNDLLDQSEAKHSSISANLPPSIITSLASGRSVTPSCAATSTPHTPLEAEHMFAMTRITDLKSRLGLLPASPRLRSLKWPVTAKTGPWSVPSDSPQPLSSSGSGELEFDSPASSPPAHGYSLGRYASGDEVAIPPSLRLDLLAYAPATPSPSALRPDSRRRHLLTPEPNHMQVYEDRQFAGSCKKPAAGVEPVNNVDLLSVLRSGNSSQSSNCSQGDEVEDMDDSFGSESSLRGMSNVLHQIHGIIRTTPDHSVPTFRQGLGCNSG